MKQLPDARAYLKLIDMCKESFDKEDSPCHDFPELSQGAWMNSISEEQSKDKVSKAHFIQWFMPLVNALKALGGTGTPEQARNQIMTDLHLTDNVIHSSDVAIKQKKALKKIMLFFVNVDIVDIYRIQWSGIKYHRNNATYRMLMNICYLIIKGMLLSTQEGAHKLAHYVDDQRMHRLYEKFVLEYYLKHYPQYKVFAAHIDWNVDDGIIGLLPLMKSDITIEFNGKILIIDTKYYEHSMQTNSFYNSRTMHSNNMYQIFTYVKNKDVNNSGNVSGVLLYAKTDEDITPDNDYMMSGNKISVKTLDLNSEFAVIKKQLDTLVGVLI